MAFTPPPLPLEFTPAQFQIWWQQVLENLQSELGALEAAQAAQAAADAANAAAATASAAAATADAAATAAQTTADDISTASALASSYVSGVTITATDAGANATINITAHTRHYPQPDGSTVDVAVNAGSVAGLAYDTYYFLYYDDPARAGGAVSYQATTSSATAAQLGDRHVVGGVQTPAAAAPDTGGSYVHSPGSGSIGGQIP